MSARKRTFLLVCISLALVCFTGRPATADGGLQHACESFRLSTRVLPEKVAITITNHGDDTVLNENVFIEVFNKEKSTWKFAACPLWFCATKETVFPKPIRSGENLTIYWSGKLHKNCRPAQAGTYRIYIQNRELSTRSTPVEFGLKQQLSGKQ